MEVTRPAMTRLARMAGVKSVSEECFPLIRGLLVQRIDDLVKGSLVVNTEHQTKTLMADDIYEALSLRGENLTQSHELGTTTIGK